MSELHLDIGIPIGAESLDRCFRVAKLSISILDLVRADLGDPLSLLWHIVLRRPRRLAGGVLSTIWCLGRSRTLAFGTARLCKAGRKAVLRMVTSAWMRQFA